MFKEVVLYNKFSGMAQWLARLPADIVVMHLNLELPRILDLPGL